MGIMHMVDNHKHWGGGGDGHKIDGLLIHMHVLNGSGHHMPKPISIHVDPSHCLPLFEIIIHLVIFSQNPLQLISRLAVEAFLMIHVTCLHSAL